MATYTQPGAKRAKVRELRMDQVDYFQTIDKLEHNGAATRSESGSYRHYHAAERVHGRAMDDWAKISVSLTEFRGYGSEALGKHTTTTTCPWDDGTDSLDNHKRCIKALFDLCHKLGVKYFTAYDSDLVPAGDWDEAKGSWDDVTDFILDCMQRYHVKLLWIAPDLHSLTRYTSGALTSSDPTTVAHAASQIKRCLEVSQRLNAECFLMCPIKECYDTIYHTDINKELKLFAKILKITAEYKERLNYRCQLILQPYYGGVTVNNRYKGLMADEKLNHYMWDVTSCLYFLKNYNLERWYKVVTPPGHHMVMANAYNMLGGVTITNEVDPCDAKTITLMMKSILDLGAAPPGGVILKLRPRRDADLRDIVTTYAKYIDAIARGLRVAASLAADQLFAKHLQQRYAAYYSGFGSRLITSDVTMDECEEYYKKNQSPPELSSKREHLDVAFQRYLDSCDHL